jgi:hypothetical protein
MLGIEGRDGLFPSPFYHRAGGAPRLHMVGRPQGVKYDLLLEVEPGTETVSPLRQIIFDHPIAGLHPIAILESMKGHPEVLVNQVKQLGLENAKPAHVFAAPDEISWVAELIKSVGGVPSGEWKTTTFNPQKIQLVTDINVTEEYFRAVAKIAFHYTLKFFPDLMGTEPDFEPIKDYIWTGSNADRFVTQESAQFVHHFRHGYRPTKWMHILAVERTYNSIVAHAQFFAGPRSLPLPYRIWIGRNPSRIDRHPELRAHNYVILDPTANSGAVGIMEDAQPLQYVRPF